MDLKNYIDSGVIERYLLGLATPEQERELTYMRRLHPILEQEIAAAELRLENNIMAEAVPPPVRLKDRVMEDARRYKHQEYYFKHDNGGGGEQPPHEPVYIDIRPGWNRKITVSIWWRCAFLALCVLTMSLAASTWYLYKRTNQLEEVLIRLKTPAEALLPASH